VIPRQYNEPLPERDDWIGSSDTKPRGARQLVATAWPTVFEVNATLAAARLSTGLQILKGEGRYFGLEYTRPEEFRARRWSVADRRRWLKKHGIVVDW